MNKHKKKSTPEAVNTVQPGPVELTNDDLQTLDSIIKHWNASKKPEDPEWDAKSTLAQLARLAVQSMTADYGDEPRKPTYETTAPKPAEHLTPPPTEA